MRWTRWRPGPGEGRSPTTLQNAGGLRSDPPASLPSAIGSIRAATATAAPPLLPPHVFVRSYGFRVAPNTVLKVCDPAPNSGVFVLPTVMAPAVRIRVTMSASRVGHVVAIERRSASRPDACGVHEVLVRHRQAVQHADGTATDDCLVGRGRASHRLLGDERDDGVDLRIHTLDLRKMRGHDFARRDLLASESRREFDGGHLTQL